MNYKYNKIIILEGDTFSIDKKPLNEVTLEDKLNDFKQASKRKIEIFKEIRNTTDTIQKKFLKKQLTGIFYNINKSVWKSTESIQALFNNDNLVINPLTMIDIDYPDITLKRNIQLEDIKEHIFKSLPYIITAMISPSGNGLKLVVYLDPLQTKLITINSYNIIIKKIHSLVEKNINCNDFFNVKLDYSCANLTKSHYESYDPNILIRPSNELIPIEVKPYIIEYLKELNLKKIADENTAIPKFKYSCLSETVAYMMPDSFKSVSTKYTEYNSHLARLTFTWALLYLSDMRCIDIILQKYSTKQAGIKSFTPDKWKKNEKTTWFLLLEIAKQQDDPSFYRAVKVYQAYYAENKPNKLF